MTVDIIHSATGEVLRENVPDDEAQQVLDSYQGDAYAVPADVEVDKVIDVSPETAPPEDTRADARDMSGATPPAEEPRPTPPPSTAVSARPFVAPELGNLGKLMAASGFFQDAADAAKACVKIQAGYELGIPPVQAMTGLNVIKGRVEMSAAMMATCIKRSGRYNYRVTEHSREICRIRFYEHGEFCGESSFTVDDAKDAGLISGPNKQNWEKYRRNMLFARAMSNGAKWYCADVFGGPAYTPDEFGAVVDEDGERLEPAKEVTPEPEPRRKVVSETVEIVETVESKDGNEHTVTKEQAELAEEADQAYMFGVMPSFRKEPINDGDWEDDKRVVYLMAIDPEFSPLAQTIDEPERLAKMAELAVKIRAFFHKKLVGPWNKGEYKSKPDRWPPNVIKAYAMLQLNDHYKRAKVQKAQEIVEKVDGSEGEVLS